MFSPRLLLLFGFLLNYLFYIIYTPEIQETWPAFHFRSLLLFGIRTGITVILLTAFSLLLVFLFYRLFRLGSMKGEAFRLPVIFITGMTFLIIFLASIQQKETTQAADSSDAKYELSSYYFTEGDFSLNMPQEPSKKVSKQKAATDFVQTYFYQSCINDCTIAYSASFADFGKGSLIAKDSDTALEIAKAGALRNANGKLTYESYIDYKGYPGKEHKINVETHQGLYVLIQRVYVIEGKVYELNVSTPARSQFMPEHYKFLDSFKIGK